MTELLESVVSWPTLLLAFVIYGFAPGFLLRPLVLLYENDDPRRTELITELYEVPRWERPFWVAQQIETVIYEGLGPRIRWMLTGRVILRWKLGDGVKHNRLAPTTFWIPSGAEKDLIEPGDHVKLMFRQSDGWSERMWVVVDKIGRRRIIGYLNNEPLDFPRLYPGRKISFHRKHIIDILPPGFDDTMQDQHMQPICSECGSVAPSAAMEGTKSAAEGREDKAAS